MTTCNDQAGIDQICRAVYGDTRKFLHEIDFKPPFEFKILNGPPKRNAEILFIGYQPGGGKEDAEEEIAKGTHKGWPEKCEYAHERWRLAPKMRHVFGVERLQQCVGTNAIFLRYPNQNCYRRHVPGEKREEIEKFCVEKVSLIVRTIKPKQIVTIGFAALEMFGQSEIELLRPIGTNLALTKTGTVADRKAVGMIHLTGARPGLSTAELDLLRNRFKPTNQDEDNSGDDEDSRGIREAPH
jgi:hypothetical protein